MPNKKFKREKLELVFDNKEREEFLTGFSKRKQARKKVARDVAEKQFKDEINRIKKRKREKIKQRLDEITSVRRANGMELAEIARSETEREKILDLPQHVVTITSAEEMDLFKSNDTAYLGSNVQSDDVEVIDVASGDDDSQDDPENCEKTDEKKTKNSERNSASRFASLAKKAQMFKPTKKRPKSDGGKMPKSQKKYLRRKSKQKPRASR